MIHCWIILATVTVVLLGSAGAQGIKPAVKDPLGDNAALAYWQAMVLLPKLEDQQDSALVDAASLRKPVDEELVKAIRSSRGAFRQFHRGTTISRCVWGFDVDAGIEAPLVHLNQARQIARFACVRTRWHFDEKRNGRAIDELVDGLIFARHAGNDGLVISLLVEYAIEAMLTDVAAANLPKLAPAELDRFDQCIEALPEAKTMAYAMKMEKELLLEWFIRELAKPDSKRRIFAMIPDVGDNPNIAALKKLSEEELRQAAINLRPVYDELIEMMALPPDEVEKRSKEYEKNPPLQGASMHFAGLLLPAVVPARRNEATSETRLLMLQAAIAVVKDGQPSLRKEDLADPYGDGPYKYVKLDDGFRIESRLIDRHGKPVTLTVGGPPEK